MAEEGVGTDVRVGSGGVASDRDGGEGVNRVLLVSVRGAVDVECVPRQDLTEQRLVRSVLRSMMVKTCTERSIAASTLAEELGVAPEHAEQWLQTLGTGFGFEQLEEHFEEPADESEAAMAAMVAKALVKAGVHEEQDIPNLEQGFLSAYYLGGTKMSTVMTKADFSGNDLGASGAIIVAAFLPKCK